MVTNIETTASVTVGNIAIVTVAAVAAGTYTLTIRASGLGVTDAVASLQTTVTAAPATGDFSIALTPATVSLQAGGSAAASVAITRTGGFTAAVGLTIQGAPAGLTGSFSPQTATGATSTLTLVAVASLTPGTYSVTIVGQTPGLPNRATVASVQVAAGGPAAFTVALDPPAMEVSPGPTLSLGSIHITRAQGFTGPVTVTVAPFVPAGALVSAGANPATVADDATNFSVLVPEGHPSGTYTTTFKVSAPGVADQIVPFTMTVVPPSSGSIQWHFCVDFLTSLFAVRDGTGPWRRVHPSWSNGEPTYSFDIAQNVGTVVQVLPGAKTSPGPLIGGFTTRVYTGTAQEIRTIAAGECEANPNTTQLPTINGTVTGLASNETSAVSVGRTAAVVGFDGATRSYVLSNVPTGIQDLIASRSVYVADGVSPGQYELNRVVARRATNVVAGTPISAIDFNSSESFGAARGTVTFTNAPLAPYSVESSIHTTRGASHTFNVRPIPLAATFHPIFGFPSTELRPGDAHRFSATTPDGSTTQRRVSVYATEVGTVSATFGPDLAAPTFTTLPPQGGLSGVVRATGSTPSEYSDGVALHLGETIDDPRVWILYATRAGLGVGTGYDLQVPDLSGVAGVRRAWYIRSGATSQWRLTMHGGAGAITRPYNFFTVPSPWLTASRDGWENMMRPAPGVTLKSAQASGAFTP